MPLLETKDYWRCPDCQKFFTEEDAISTRIYECQCGNKFTAEDAGGPRCDQCNKFAERVDSAAGTKKDAFVCPDCSTTELEEEEAIACAFCDEIYTEDDLPSHLEADHGSEIIEDWIADKQSALPEPNDFIVMITRLAHYVYQMETDAPEAILNPIHLWPGKDETQQDVEARNATLLNDAMDLLKRANRPLHVSVR